MNKKSIILFAIYFLPCTTWTIKRENPAMVVEDSEIVIDEKTNTILFRYYLCKRLQIIMNYLIKIEENEKVIDQKIIEKIAHYDYLFNHQKIHDTIQLISTHKSFQPLINLWLKVKEYKFIHDTDLIQEFIFLVYICCQNFVKDKNNFKTILVSLLAKNKSIHTSHISFQFYLNKRLKDIKHLVIELHHLNIKGIPDKIHFKHPHILKCIDEMLQTHNTQSLQKLIQQFESYAFLDDKLLVKEFLQLHFLVLKNIYLDHKNKPLKENSHLFELTIPELLDALDEEYNRVNNLKLALSQQMIESKTINSVLLIAIITLASLGILVL